MSGAQPADVPVETRRERRKREVHDRILQAAVTLFERQGVEATTVEEICRVADVAEKTFYNHFPTKQLLSRELAEGFVAQLHEMLEDARKQPLSTRERLFYFFELVTREIEQFGQIHRELIVEILRVAQIDGSGPGQRLEIHASFGALLREGIAAGDVRSPHSVEFLTEMAAGLFAALMTNWLSLSAYPLQERLEEAAAFLGAAIDPKAARR